MPRTIQEKALIFAVSEFLYRVVDVIEEDEYYIARVEDPYSLGKYHRVGVRKTQQIQEKIAYGIKDLEWRAAGNEFPLASAAATHDTP